MATQSAEEVSFIDNTSVGSLAGRVRLFFTLHSFSGIEKGIDMKKDKKKEIFHEKRVAIRAMQNKDVTRGGQKRISARPYPAGFERSGRVAKDRAGLPKRGTAPVSARRFLHTRRVFQYPAGILLPGWSTRNPAGWSGTRLPVAPLSRRQMAT